MPPSVKIEFCKSPSTGNKNRGKPRRRRETFGFCINKVLKLLHPDMGLSTKAVAIVNCFVNDILERIAAEASFLASYNKRCTISSREIQTAVRLILPGYLAKFSAIEGTKAIRNFSSHK
ncbi:late histone H2B.L4-like [Branchiostoma floridae]|uniref:Late histone H2B.L4-like n=1 Tax=Branchiostoma floridae TaxID=7739 RepID=A0A9J7KTU0_BRAFL|nr:late histone H2B.L4-like [Branchiostoma floridae]